MSQQEKLIAKFKAANGVFKWSDLVSLLKGLGFEQYEGAGSRVSFQNGSIIIKLHKPHPQKEVKAYAVRQVKEVLISEGLI